MAGSVYGVGEVRHNWPTDRPPFLEQEREKKASLFSALQVTPCPLCPLVNAITAESDHMCTDCLPCVSCNQEIFLHRRFSFPRQPHVAESGRVSHTVFLVCYVDY